MAFPFRYDHAATTMPGLSAGLPAPAARLVLPERDHAALLAEDAARPRTAPLRYGVAESVAVSAQPTERQNRA
jgi:hypothetical protein